jgi:hypothetical protein
VTKPRPIHQRRRPPTRPAIALIALIVVVGCGSSRSVEPFPSRSYEIALVGIPGAFAPMAPHGSASATIRFVGSARQVCWSFRDLRGVSDPTSAAIRLGVAGEYGSVLITLGPRYSSGGCTGPVTGTLVNAIVASPAGYYVEIDSRRYSADGAIRAQL